MDLLLDTSTLSFILNGNRLANKRFRAALSAGAVYASVISEGELVYGALRLGRERRRELLEEITLLLADFAGLVPVTRDVAFKYGEIRRDLVAQGRMIGLNDVWIGATALSAGLAVATSDRGFNRIEGLVVEDWLVP